MLGHVLHLQLLHGEKPGLMFGGVVVEWTSMSLRLLGLRKAVIGGSGMAFLHLSEECRTGRCLRRMLEMLGSAGLYVWTRGILSA